MTSLPNAMDGYGDDTPAVDPSAAISVLNGLLRGEISAVQTYSDVIGRMAAHAAAPVATLTAIQSEHDRAVGLLRSRISALGGEPADNAGLWGLWEHALQGTLSLFGGDTGSLRVLQEAEEHGLSDYRSAVDAVDAVSGRLIQDQLIPMQECHLSTLDGLVG